MESEMLREGCIFRTMVNAWRDVLPDGDVPFLSVQMPIEAYIMPVIKTTDVLVSRISQGSIAPRLSRKLHPTAPNLITLGPEVNTCGVISMLDVSSTNATFWNVFMTRILNGMEHVIYALQPIESFMGPTPNAAYLVDDTSARIQFQNHKLEIISTNSTECGYLVQICQQNLSSCLKATSVSIEPSTTNFLVANFAENLAVNTTLVIMASKSPSCRLVNEAGLLAITTSVTVSGQTQLGAGLRRKRSYESVFSTPVMGWNHWNGEQKIITLSTSKFVCNQRFTVT